MADQAKTAKRVVVVGAHDDDPIIGVGGTLLKRHAKADCIQMIILTNGENSHRVVLGVHDCPSPVQVARAREFELLRALDEFRSIGLAVSRYQWDFPDTCGVLTSKKEKVKQSMKTALNTFEPDVVYFQAPDAHEDHRLAYHAVSEVLEDVNFQGETYLYAIWTKELALMRPEVDVSMIEEIPGQVEVVDVRDVLAVKRRALHRFTSQIQLWPYLDWQPQEKPILDAGFIRYFLRGEEVIYRVR